MERVYKTDENGCFILGEDNLAKAENTATKFFKVPIPINASSELNFNAPEVDLGFLFGETDDEESKT